LSGARRPHPIDELVARHNPIRAHCQYRQQGALPRGPQVQLPVAPPGSNRSQQLDTQHLYALGAQQAITSKSPNPRCGTHRPACAPSESIDGWPPRPYDATAIAATHSLRRSRGWNRMPRLLAVHPGPGTCRGSRSRRYGWSECDPLTWPRLLARIWPHLVGDHAAAPAAESVADLQTLYARSPGVCRRAGLS